VTIEGAASVPMKAALPARKLRRFKDWFLVMLLSLFFSVEEPTDGKT